MEKQRNHWTLAAGPKFTPKQRAVINLERPYSIQPVEICGHFIFKRRFPVHKLAERS